MFGRETQCVTRLPVNATVGRLLVTIALSRVGCYRLFSSTTEPLDDGDMKRACTFIHSLIEFIAVKLVAVVHPHRCHGR